MRNENGTVWFWIHGTMWHMHGQHTIEQFKKYHSAIPLEVNDMLVSFDTFCICLSIISKKVKSKRGTVGYNHLFKENEGWETSNLSTTGYSMLKLVALTAFNILIYLDRGIFASFVWQQCRKKKWIVLRVVWTSLSRCFCFPVTNIPRIGDP